MKYQVKIKDAPIGIPWTDARAEITGDAANQIAAAIHGTMHPDVWMYSVEIVITCQQTIQVAPPLDKPYDLLDSAVKCVCGHAKTQHDNTGEHPCTLQRCSYFSFKRAKV